MPRPSKIQDVVFSFDAGDTLIYGNPVKLLASSTGRTEEEACEAWISARSAIEQGYEIGETQVVISPVHKFWPAVYRLALSRLLDDPILAEATYAQVIQARQKHDFFVVRPGVKAVLQWLRALNCRLIVSSNWTAELGLLLDRLELRIYFSAIYTSAALGHKKPQPEFYKIISEIENKPIWHFGNDETNDLNAAQMAGWQGFLIDPADDFEEFFRYCIEDQQ